MGEGFIEAAAGLGLTVVANEPLARHTTFRIGGPADLYVAVSDVEKLAQAAELARAHGIPYTILGGGSNVLVSDAGVRGLVIANQTRDFGLQIADCRLQIADSGASSSQSAGRNPQLVADSGVPLAGLARWAIRAGWAGLEWAVSVPGTVGGAVIGNAGAHGGCIADSLAWALIHDPGQSLMPGAALRPIETATHPASSLQAVWRSNASDRLKPLLQNGPPFSGQGRRTLTALELGYSYRNSILKDQTGSYPPIVLAAGFDMTRGDVAEMTGRADGFLARRRASQPVEPSAGSVFRNPPGDHAGRLIEAVGLKGHRLGGAQISPRHANFIVNTGDARSADVLGLIRLAQSRVFERFGVELELEILLIGPSSEGVALPTGGSTTALEHSAPFGGSCTPNGGSTTALEHSAPFGGSCTPDGGSRI